MRYILTHLTDTILGPCASIYIEKRGCHHRMTKQFNSKEAALPTPCPKLPSTTTLIVSLHIRTSTKAPAAPAAACVAHKHAVSPSISRFPTVSPDRTAINGTPS